MLRCMDNNTTTETGQTDPPTETEVTQTTTETEVTQTTTDGPGDNSLQLPTDLAPAALVMGY
jgi:hypothetical protein